MGNRIFTEPRESKAPLGFVKTTAIGALLVVVPIAIIGFALWQIYALAKGMLGPVFATLPFDDATQRMLDIISAVLLLILICWVTGALVRTRWGKKFRGWVERMLLGKIPGYTIIRSLVHQYLGEADERKFQPVMVDLYDSGTKMIGLEIEELGDGTVAVFLPSVPAVTLGQVQIVPSERVTDIPATLHETIESLTMFGEGAAKLIEPSDETNN